MPCHRSGRSAISGTAHSARSGDRDIVDKRGAAITIFLRNSRDARGLEDAYVPPTCTQENSRRVSLISPSKTR
jgi:hypothetical protein